MFGYVKPLKAELKVSEYEKYRGIYCGLCRAIGKTTGQLSRMTLSYDLVFLAAVRMIIEGVTPTFTPLRCAVHPTTRRAVADANPALTYSAAVSAILALEKNSDDRHDERGAEKLKSDVLRPFLSHTTKRAKPCLPPECTECAKAYLEDLSDLEKEKCASADVTASSFGELLKYLFSMNLEGEKKALAGRIGYGVGRFVYICDAADDLEEDIKKGLYNPIAEGWGTLAVDCESGMMSDIVKESVRCAALIDLEELGRAAEELDSGHMLTPIIKNIIYFGLPASLDEVLEKKKPAKIQ